MAFNFLSQLIDIRRNEEDEGSPVDDVEGENDNESDLDVDDRYDSDLDRDVSDSDESESEGGEDRPGEGSDQAGWAWSHELENVEVELFTRHTGPNLGDMDLDFTSEPYEFFKLFFPDTLVIQITEQTNLYAVQKEAPRSFIPVTNSDINQFLYVNIMFGIHKLPSQKLYWSKDPLLRVAAIADAVSRDRYRQISQYFHLTDSQQFVPRGQPGHDPLHKIRPAIDTVLSSCQTYYAPDEDYQKAIELYSDAIAKNPFVATYYGNRSFAYLRTECFGYALTDASKALSLDKNYIKAYYRRASANMALGKFKLALKDFETVTKVRPNDKDARLKFNECSKITKRIAFEKAIASEDGKSLADSIDIESLQIEPNYDGPLLENGEVTQTFVESLMEAYKNQKKLPKKFVCQILIQAKKLFSQQESLVHIKVPEKCKFTICGDIHGQYYDLLNIFKMNGNPSKENPYLFNGDFVDRGSFSVECIMTLLSYKLLYPDHFFMARGNHESLTMNQMYGFEGEVKSKYSTQLCELFTEVFNWLPLAHCINNKILVMHGGLFSNDEVTLNDIAITQRNRQPPESGIMCELLWSDPQPQAGRAPSKRGVGVQFGPDVTKNFLQKNNLDYVVRSHEVKNEGYECMHDNKCITVFSAPNYCDTMGNKGAYITIQGDDLTPKFTSYDAVPHPNVKPMAYANPFFGLF